MAIQISKFADKHLATVIRLLNDEYANSLDFIPFDEKRIKSSIRRRDLMLLVAEETDKAKGLIGTHPEENREVSIHWLAADQTPDRKTVADMLVKEIEDNAPGETVSTALDQKDPRIDEWIDRGYAISPGWLQMSAKLDSLKSIPKIAKDVELRTLEPGEEEELITVMNAGFGWQRLKPGTIENWKSEDPPFTEDWVQIAEIEGRIVSAVVAKPDTDYNNCFHKKRGNLGPAATLTEFRNRHLASALTTQAMNILLENGMDSVRLGTSELNVASRALLKSLGFQIIATTKVMRKRLKTNSKVREPVNNWNH
jgi:ribosomal protein S18 acetylase RimI-like enzyme